MNMLSQEYFIFYLIINVVIVKSQTITTPGVPIINNFIQFGIKYGDQTMERRLDAVTDPIEIKERFPFFNKVYEEIRVWSHGFILFGNLTYILPHAPPGPFPLEDFIGAAPYWADTDIQQDEQSNVFYREIDDRNTLTRITNMVRDGFPQLSNQNMLWAFVATWYRVPGHFGEPGRNTYQAILTTNGLYSFVLFTYHEIQWSSGLWGGYPQMGFNAGDQVNYLTLKQSFTLDAITVVNDSNIGFPGRFIFHTTGNVTNVQCESVQGLQASPFRGSIYGGYELKLFGICFNQSNYTIEINENKIENCSLYGIYIICTMPMIDEGRLKIRLFDQTRFIGETDFLAFIPESNAYSILTNSIELENTILTNNNNDIILYFQSNTLTKNNLFRLIIYDYSAQYFLNNDTVYNKNKRRIDLGFGAMNLSNLNNLTIPYNTIFSNTSDNQDRFHSLTITFELVSAQKRSRRLTRGEVEVFLHILATAVINPAYCAGWLALQSDSNTQNLIDEIPPCPSRVRTSWDEEQLGYKVDEACDPNKSNELNCLFHQGAKGCYRRQSSISNAGAQCCYDNQGVWIDDWRKGAGTLDAYSPDNFQTKTQHFFSDFLSYLSCCYGPGVLVNACEQYMKYRPSGRSENLLPTPIGGRGDPHFSTLNGSSYTFNGHGEYVLIKQLLIPLEIQVRLAPISNDVSLGIVDNATGIIAFVIQNGNQSRVQLELFSKSRTVEIRINERLLESVLLSDFDKNLTSSLILYSDEYQLTIRQTDSLKLTISFGINSVQIDVDIRPQFDFLNLLTTIPRSMLENANCQGLLGDLNGLVFPNSTRISTLDNDDRKLFDYGESWRTTNISSLFYYDLLDSHNQHQNFNYRPIFRNDLFNKYINTTRYQMAEEACQNLTDSQQCIYDILITNDKSVSLLHQQYQENQLQWKTYAQLVINGQIDISTGASNPTQSTSITISDPLSTSMKTSDSINTGRTLDSTHIREILSSTHIRETSDSTNNREVSVSTTSRGLSVSTNTRAVSSDSTTSREASVGTNTRAVSSDSTTSREVSVSTNIQEISDSITSRGISDSTTSRGVFSSTSSTSATTLNASSTSNNIVNTSASSSTSTVASSSIELIPISDYCSQ